ncbi:MAG: HAD-IIA family hydrolase [Candidatus Eiseniibacteriota bacterium]|jgi:NagD protein
MQAILCDIDGVLMHGNAPIDGAAAFIHGLLEQQRRFLLLTNYPSQTPADLENRFAAAGIRVPADRFYTSAMATAAFLERQAGRKAYVIGEGALTHALYSIGFTVTDIDPDVVVVGETRAYGWEMIHRAARFVARGARFIATNPDVAGPGCEPACGALCAPIERITGKKPFYVGKPSPWIMRAALNSLDAHSEASVIIGDNMSTDIMAGTQAGMRTILVLSGVTRRADLDRYPYRPGQVLESVGAIDLDAL